MIRPYLLVYRIEGDTVTVLAVFDARHSSLETTIHPLNRAVAPSAVVRTLTGHTENPKASNHHPIA